jgi:ribosomal protein S25
MNIAKIEKWLFLEIKKFGEVQYREKEKKKTRKEENKKRTRREQEENKKRTRREQEENKKRTRRELKNQFCVSIYIVSSRSHDPDFCQRI